MSFKRNDRVRQTDDSLSRAPSTIHRERMTGSVVGYPFTDQRIVEVAVDGCSHAVFWHEDHWELAASAVVLEEVVQAGPGEGENNEHWYDFRCGACGTCNAVPTSLLDRAAGGTAVTPALDTAVRALSAIADINQLQPARNVANQCIATARGALVEVAKVASALVSRVAPASPQQSEGHMVPHRVPDITDPMGKYWNQPSRDAIAIDGAIARMNKATMEQLPEYSCTLPTGTYVGKMWRCSTREGWQLCWYDRIEGEHITIERRRIELTDTMAKGGSC